MMFQTLDPLQSDFQYAVIQDLETGFKLYGPKKKAQAALEMLALFFNIYSFDFKSFVKQMQFSKKENELFLSYLLYEIYYSKIFFLSLSTTSISHLLWVFVAESLDKQALEKKLLKLDPHSIIALMKHCGLYMSEGSWNILDSLSQMDPWMELAEGIRSRYYEPSLLDETESRATVLSILDEHANSQVQLLMDLLPGLVEAVICSPICEFEETEKAIRLKNPHYIPDETTQQRREYHENQSHTYAKTFAQYEIFSLTFEQLRDFFKVFGLWGIFVQYPVVKNSAPALVTLLEGIKKLLQNPLTILETDLEELIIFVRSLCIHLHIFHHEPIQYFHGLKRIVYTLATSKDNLPDQFWLPTLLESLSALVKYFHRHNLPQAKLSDYPIIVFDQNEEKTFLKNSRYIERLAKQQDATIWHLSNAQAGELAKNLDIEDWIETTPEKKFGYGGARNCQFLLAPVIHRSIQQGCRSWSDLMKLSPEDLRRLFETAVLGIDGEDAIINLGEDDVAVHLSSCFVDAISAEANHTHYFFHHSLCKGRYTMLFPSDLGLWNMKGLLEEIFPVWLDIPLPGGMKGMLSKPRFCLPLPFGSEELHVILPHFWKGLFHQPLIHLSGARYPQKAFPISPMDGMGEKLASFSSYAFQVFLTTELIDPNHRFRRSIALWNQHPEAMQLFRSLNDLQEYVFDPDTLKEFRQRFWKNFQDFFGPPTGEYPMKIVIGNYIHQSIPKELPLYLKRFYRQLKVGAQMFFDFGNKVLEYFQKGEMDFIKKAKEEVENDHQKQILDTMLVRDLYLLLDFVESFGIRVKGL